MGKIGITEQGDAALDLSWTDKLNTVDGAILITKELTGQFLDAVFNAKEKIILHMTCTGFGGSAVEPNVPKYQDTLSKLRITVSNGFPVERVVVRVDPIIPTEKGIARAKSVMCMAHEYGFNRFRISVLDMYRHVKERFLSAKLPLPYGDNFQASDRQFAALDQMLLEFIGSHTGSSVECCAEPRLKVPRHTGCVGEYECNLFGVTHTIPYHSQRSACLCCAEKTELLSRRHPCSHKCIYCYWKDF